MLRGAPQGKVTHNSVWKGLSLLLISFVPTVTPKPVCVRLSLCVMCMGVSGIYVCVCFCMFVMFIQRINRKGLSARGFFVLFFYFGKPTEFPELWAYDTIKKYMIRAKLLTLWVRSKIETK